MKVFYSRISTIQQNEERQLYNVNKDEFDYTFVDKCSGSIPLFERAKGKQIKELIDKKQLELIEVNAIDRLGRNTLDVLNNIRLFTELGIVLVCRNPYLRNIKQDGTEDEVSKLVISILSAMAEFERALMKERQKEGIEIAKLKGKYTGRRVGTQESLKKFMSKPKNKKIARYLSSGYTYFEISKIVGCSFGTIQKVKKLYTTSDLGE